MFRMNEVGGRIAAKRKEMNMTQMELADRMGVSFQAVSNWERGNSMPDIAKLPELSEVLGMSSDDLLSDGAPARLIRHILDGDEEEYIKDEAFGAEAVADVASILKPQQAESLLESVLEHGAENINIGDLVDIAPFVSSDFLHNLVMKIATVDNISLIISLAPFLSEASLDALADKVAQEGLHLRSLVPLAPFLSRKALAKLVDHAMVDTDTGALSALAPFLSESSLDAIVRNIMNADTPDVRSLAGLAPLLPSKTLDAMAMRAIDGEEKIELASLAPFLSEETLKACTSKLLERMDLGTLKKLAPFL